MSSDQASIVLSLEQAKASLQKTVDGLRAEADALTAARERAGGDHFKMLEEAGVIMAQVQHPIVAELGYTADDDGLMHYTSAVRNHEADEAISSLMALVHVIVLMGEGAVPKLALQQTSVSYEEVLLSARGAKPK